MKSASVKETEIYINKFFVHQFVHQPEQKNSAKHRCLILKMPIFRNLQLRPNLLKTEIMCYNSFKVLCREGAEENANKQRSQEETAAQRMGGADRRVSEQRDER